MVFYTLNILMKPRDRRLTKDGLRVLCGHVYAAGGLIRKLSNEGIMRPYKKFRDIDLSVITHVRYVQFQIDIGESDIRNIVTLFNENADVFKCMCDDVEAVPFLKADKMAGFVRLEEEVNWPPQATTDIYEQLDKNWKEFSRTRWSNYLRQ